MTDNMCEMDPKVSDALEARGVTTSRLQSEGFWSPDVYSGRMAATLALEWGILIGDPCSHRNSRGCRPERRRCVPARSFFATATHSRIR